MSSPRYAAPLWLEPQPSRRLGGLLILLHLIAALALFATGLSAGFTGALAGLLLLSLGYSLSLHARWITPPGWLATRRIESLLWDSEGRWQLTLADGSQHDATLQRDYYLHPGLLLLNFAGDRDRRLTLVLLPDSLPPEVHRQLRVRLRVEGTG